MRTLLVFLLVAIWSSVWACGGDQRVSDTETVTAATRVPPGNDLEESIATIASQDSTHAGRELGEVNSQSVSGTPAAAGSEPLGVEVLEAMPEQGQPHLKVPPYMDGVWLCRNLGAPFVDDLTTETLESNRCSVTVEYTDGFAIVKSNGIPNHDYESTVGCCASEQDYVWKIPLTPQMSPTAAYAPERGPVAISVNGVPLFGPEDGPGGDAVAAHHNYYTEDRQKIVLGVCGGHSGPGGAFHYHFDASCVHWHPKETGMAWKDWTAAFLRPDVASPVIGFAFDGYPIYGPFGNDSTNNLNELTSSYKLKEGKTGYGGIDDWEYIPGLGDLDECNGINSKIPGVDQDIYHYHASRKTGLDSIGFPYFILCYRGIPEASNFDKGGSQVHTGRPEPQTGPGDERPR